MCNNDATPNKYKIVEVQITGATPALINSYVLNAVNVGLGESIFKNKTGTTLNFKTLVGSGNTQIFDNGNEVIVYSSGSTISETTANNGLTKVGDNIRLGGPLTGNTFINLNSTSRKFIVSGNTAAAGTPSIEVNTTGAGAVKLSQSSTALQNEIGLLGGAVYIVNKNNSNNAQSVITNGNTQIRLQNIDSTGKINQVDVNNLGISWDVADTKSLDINLGNTSSVNLLFPDSNYWTTTKDGVTSIFYDPAEPENYLETQLTQANFKLNLVNLIGGSSINGTSTGLNLFASNILSIAANRIDNTVTGQRFQMTSTGGTIFTDSRVNKRGIQYSGNYSTGFTKHSLVDKNYVTGITSTLTGTSTSAGNGLNKFGNVIRLGGTVTADTSISFDNATPKTIYIGSDAFDNGITVNGAGVTISGGDISVSSYNSNVLSTVNNSISLYTGYTDIANTNGYILIRSTEIVNGYSGFIKISDTGLTISNDTPSFEGIKYAANYSTDFTDRSLIDKGYLLSQISGVTGGSSSVTVNNGLTKVGNNIRLGGLLTGHTAIDGAYNLNLGVNTVLNSFGLRGTTVDMRGSTVGLSRGTSSQDLKFEMFASTGAFFTDSQTTKHGIQYAADNYETTKRSLTSKGFVTGITDTLLTKTSFNSYTASTSTTINDLKKASLKNVGSSYSILESDLGKIIQVTGSTDSTITFTSGLTDNFQVSINNLMLLNKVTIAAGAGVTLELKGTQLLNQYDGASLYKTNNKIRGFGNL